MGVKSFLVIVSVVLALVFCAWYDFSEPRSPDFWIAQGTWVTGICTLLLGAIALWGSSLVELWKRPKLEISYHHQTPDCHKTEDKRGSNTYPVHIFRFRVINNGKTVARDCQAVIEAIAEIDGKGHVINPNKGYTPANILWGSGLMTDTINIYPNRLHYCGLCRVPSAKFQKNHNIEDHYVDPHGINFPLGFILEIGKGFNFFSQPNRFPAGKYRLKISIYSSNAAPCTKVFEINWSGKWSEQIEVMRKELAIN